MSKNFPKLLYHSQFLSSTFWWTFLENSEQKYQSYRCMKICIKMWMKTCFHSHFYSIFTSFYCGLLKQQIWYSFTLLIVPRLFEEKRRDLVFAFPSFRPSPYRSMYLVGATPPTFLYRFFWNFTGALVMVWRYVCGLDIILRLFFVTF